MRAKPPPEQPVSKFVGIWIRVSTEDQAKGESPEHHEHRARAYAESKSWRVREVYHLEGVSGKAVSEHPEAQRMLEHIRSGHITGLIFSKLARLARNTRELLDFSDLFRDAGADLISLHESIDTSTPAGRLFYTVIAAMAQWEREEIVERTAASVPIRAKLGKPLGGAAPFGYRWENRELVPDPQEAPVRKLIYELFLEQKRRKGVARVLNERGYRTRNGSPFTDTTIERLLRDPTAKGIRRANYTRRQGDSKAWVLKPEHEWILIPCPPIVSEDLWASCNAILDQRRENGRRTGRPAVHLFTGLAFCVCGQKMSVPSDSPKYVCPRCRNKIRVEDLEAVFREQLRGFLLSPEDVTRYLDQADDALQGKVERLDVLQEEERKVRVEMEKAYRLYQADQISVEGFGHLYRPLEERVKQLEEEIPRLQGEVDFLRIEVVSRDEVLSGAQDLADRWPDLAPEEKRPIVEAFVKRVEVGKDEVSISLLYLPSPSQVTPERQRNLTPALHFCRWTLRGPKPLASGYPTAPVSLGEHLRKRRIDLRLTQHRVAETMEADAWTYLLWEHDRSRPIPRFVPRIVRFLGYDPFPKGQTLGERIRAARRAQGLSHTAMARKLGVDPSTILNWERGRRHPPARFWPRILGLISREEVPLDAPLPDRLLAYRLAHGLTQAELGALVGVASSQVWNWERGRTRPNRIHLNRVEEVLGNVAV